MKVSCTELPPRQASVAIEVEQERLDRAVDAAFRRLSSRVDVPGFRRGKAPRAMLERVIGRDRVVEDALEHLVPEVVNEAIEQEGIEPYTRPRVESIEFEPLRITAVVGLKPTVELGDYSDKLKIEPEQPQVGPTQVDEVIQRLRESYAQWAPVERPVQLGDRVGLDLRATVEGRDEPVLDSKEAEYVVDPEGAQPAPGFAEQLVGVTPGTTRAFSLVLPEDYRTTELAGQPATFTVTVHWVKERQLPAVDDEFAQQVGEYTDLASLRTTVENQLREHEEERVRERNQEAALNKLIEISSIEFPPQLIDHQADHLRETFVRNVERQGLQLRQYLRLIGKQEDQFNEELRAEAESRIRRSLALDAFADAEQVAVEESEVQDEVRRAAEGTDEPEAVERLALNNPDTLQRVQEVTRERKALARLMELATGDGQASSSDAAKKPYSSDTDDRYSPTGP